MLTVALVCMVGSIVFLFIQQPRYQDFHPYENLKENLENSEEYENRQNAKIQHTGHEGKSLTWSF